MSIIVLTFLNFILGSLTVLLVNWAGGEINDYEFSRKKYAVFTFSDDRDKPVTENILMNVLIPNVCLTLLYLLYEHLNVRKINICLLAYIISFYVFRAILICVILKRREMYSVNYEFSIAAVGILFSLILIYFCFASVVNILLDGDDLKAEIWLAILLILYKFVQQILDNHVTQEKILTKNQVRKYIVNRFNSFFEKYKNDVSGKITEDNNYIFLTMFAIMIYEDFNRNSLIRKAENIKVRSGKKATVSILQITSEKPMSDSEAIKKFLAEATSKRDEYQKEQDEQYKDNLEDEPGFEIASDSFAWQFADTYNTGTDYSDAVCYIYDMLWEYFCSSEGEKYIDIFHAAVG